MIDKLKQTRNNPEPLGLFVVWLNVEIIVISDFADDVNVGH